MKIDKKRTPLSSTKKTETKSNGSSSSSSSQSKPQHTHTWVAQTKSVYHEATGHYENKWVQDSAAWDEDVYATKFVVLRDRRILEYYLGI